MENKINNKAPETTCPICYDTFCKPYNMKRHMLRIHGYTYTDYISLPIHNNSNNITETINNNEYKCSKCDKCLYANWYLIKHMEKCKGIIDRHSCEYCHKKFKHVNSRFCHYKICKIKKEKDDLALTSLEVQMNKLNINENSISNYNENNCTKCNKYFNRKWYLKKHMEKCKGIIDRYSCQYCYKKFKWDKTRFGHYKICKVKKEKDALALTSSEVVENTQIENTEDRNNNIIIKNKKQKITATMKRLVWNTHIGEEIGKTKCLCCKTTSITQLSFNCGHIIAEANNGKTIVSNLKPICQNCNSSMGTQNMDDFMKLLL